MVFSLSHRCLEPPRVGAGDAADLRQEFPRVRDVHRLFEGRWTER